MAWVYDGELGTNVWKGVDTGLYDEQGNPIYQTWWESLWNPATGFNMDPNAFAEAYTNVNPYTEDAIAALEGFNLDDYYGAFEQYVNNFDPNNPNYYTNLNINPYTLAPSAATAAAMDAADFDPAAFFNLFMNQMSGPLANLVSGQQSALQQSLTERANTLSNQAINSVMDRFGDLGSLYSTASLNEAAFQGAQPFADVANLLGQQQINLTGNLWGQGMGQAAEGMQYGAGLQQQANQQNTANQQQTTLQNALLQQQAAQQTGQWGMDAQALAAQLAQSNAANALTAGQFGAEQDLQAFLANLGLTQAQVDQALTLLGMQLGFGTPEYVAPDMVTNPAGGEAALGGIEDIASIVIRLLGLL